MFTQFFGNYLLQQQLVSPEHLSEVLRTMNDTDRKSTRLNSSHM